MKVRATLFSLMVAFAASGAMRPAAPDIHNTRLLMDGATITAPNLAIWDAEKGWIVENEGVPPDIEV
jgi:cytochrome bd-type quinol oxidase subunit 1